MVWPGFGQFVAHDMLNSVKDPNAPQDTLTTCPTGDVFPPGPLVFSPSLKTVDAYGIPQQTNPVTSYLDLSVVYGTTAAINAKLRTGASGRGRLGSRDYIGISYDLSPIGFPFSVTRDLINYPISIAEAGLQAEYGSDPFGGDNFNFATGDSRANENMQLTAHHIFWFREHNRLADKIAAAHLDWDDEEVFQEARAINIAQYQHVIYNEWLDVGFNGELPKGWAKGKYSYDEDVDASISNTFFMGFAAGHTSTHPWGFKDESGDLLYPTWPEFGPPNVPFFLGQGGGPGQWGAQLLAYGDGAAGVVRSQGYFKQSPVDLRVSDDLRNIPFGPPGFSGIDLVAVDIARTWDHALPSYYQIRKQWYDEKNQNKGDLYKAWGCDDDPVQDSLNCFSEITSNLTLATQMRDWFKKVTNIPLVMGLWAEKRNQGDLNGITMGNIILEQFERLREGDRFFYLNNFNSHEISAIEANSYRDIIARNSDPFNESLGEASNDIFSLPTFWDNSDFFCEITY
jgi:hypothetical protein